jgi:hypothetical protein
MQLANVSNYSTINKWWKSEVYLERKVPSLIFWNSVSIFSTPDDSLKKTKTEIS